MFHNSGIFEYFTGVTVGIFPKFVLKHRIYPQEISNLDGLLVTANLNR